MVGTVGGMILLILTGFDEIKFTLEPTHIWSFMTITIGSTVAFKASKWKWGKA
jgi:hypothetical protein